MSFPVWVTYPFMEIYLSTIDRPASTNAHSMNIYVFTTSALRPRCCYQHGMQVPILQNIYSHQALFKLTDK